MPRVRNTAYHYLLFLRDNNLLKMTDEGEYYVDLQLPVGLTPEDDLPIGINLGEVKQADGRPADGLLVSNKTLAGEILLTLSKENGEVLVGKDGLSRSTQVPAGGAGDMHKSVYDQDNDGIVDNSEKLGGYTVDELPISVDTQEALDDIQEELEYLQQDIEEEVEKREDADEVLQSNIDQLAEDIEDDYVKKNYALGDTSNNYKMIKAISWKVDTNGVIKFHIVSRDLSGTTTTDIEEDITTSLASATADGIMPKESFNTIQDLVTKVASLSGAIIPKGTIQLHTAAVTQEALTAFVGGTPEQGRGVKDLDNVTWVYDTATTTWLERGDGEIAQATNDDGQTVGTLGLVKGKNVDGYVFVENDGTLSVVGWDALKQRVDDIEEDVSDLQDDVVELQEKVEEIEEQLEGDTEKLDTIEEGAQKNVQSDFNETEEDSDAFIKNKPIQYKIKNATRIPTGSSFTITDTDIKATSTIILGMTNQQEGLWEVELLNDGVFTITSTAIEAEGTVFTYLVF